MEINRFLKIEEAKHGLSRAEIARRLNIQPQALSGKIMRGTLRVAELEQIAHAMDCELDIKFIDRK